MVAVEDGAAVLLHNLRRTTGFLPDLPDLPELPDLPPATAFDSVPFFLSPYSLPPAPHFFCFCFRIVFSGTSLFSMHTLNNLGSTIVTLFFPLPDHANGLTGLRAHSTTNNDATRYSRVQ